MKFNHYFKAMLIAFAAISFASCNKVEPEVPQEPDPSVKDELTVEPSSKITFAAKNNEAVTLNITTNVKEWSYEASEWLTAEKKENQLVINATDNVTTDRRMGRVTISAGKAKQVKITVMQEPAAEEGCVGHLAVVGSDNLRTPGTYSLKFTLSKASENITSATIEYDPDYLQKYNSANEVKAQLLPDAAVSFSGENKVLIPAGRLEGDNLSFELTYNTSKIAIGQKYIVPFTVKTISNADVYMAEDTKTIYFSLFKDSVHEIRNALINEVNSENPLNALEFELQDGTNFFDAVILFSANINYNATDDAVILHQNPSVKQILDEHTTYIKPLRDKHIKVYLSLLGNHDRAGLCCLSDKGAKNFAKQVARIIKDCELDGVMLDDEYSYPENDDNPWFAQNSPAQGARLCYELKKAMKQECSWPTDVVVYQLGTFNNELPHTVKDLETKQDVPLKDFIDIIFPNYGTGPWYFGSLGPEQCARHSVNCVTKEGLDKINVPKAKEQGYGWLMWYALMPVPKVDDNDKENLSDLIASFKYLAPQMFGSELKDVTGYYKKVSKGEDGAFDPKRYEF